MQIHMLVCIGGCIVCVYGRGVWVMYMQIHILVCHSYIVPPPSHPSPGNILVRPRPQEGPLSQGPWLSRCISRWFRGNRLRPQLVFLDHGTYVHLLPDTLRQQYCQLWCAFVLGDAGTAQTVATAMVGERAGRCVGGCGCFFVDVCVWMCVFQDVFFFPIHHHHSSSSSSSWYCSSSYIIIIIIVPTLPLPHPSSSFIIIPPPPPHYHTLYGVHVHPYTPHIPTHHTSLHTTHPYTPQGASRSSPTQRLVKGPSGRTQEAEARGRYELIG